MNRQSLVTLTALLRRELWESPVAFKWTPLAIGALIVIFAVVALMVGARFDAGMAFTNDAIRLFSEQPLDERRFVVSGLMFSFATIFFQLMILIILFYLAGSLFDDRKDRSILFWKSLPVSDRMTVASKIVTASVLIPGLFLIAIALTQLALLVIASGYSLSAGVNPFTTVWLPASLPRLWTVMALGLLVQALWLMPIYAWLVFCSSWAPRLPILIAIAIPAGIAIVQHSWSMVTRFQMPEFNIGLIMLKRLGSGVLPMSANVDFSDSGSRLTDISFDDDLFMSFSHVFSHFGKAEMWIGLAIAGILLAAATWFRRRATDNA